MPIEAGASENLTLEVTPPRSAPAGRYPVVVEVAGGPRLARPSEAVLDILPADAFNGPFVKEDGEAVLDAEGRRIA